jgi:hypothetical protein
MVLSPGVSDTSRASAGATGVLAGLALLLALAALLVTLSAFQLFENDLWWHLASGEWILEHHAIPRADPFTSTMAGAPWVDFEWGSQILLALVHRAGGAFGFVLLRVLSTLLAGGMLLRILTRRGASLALAVALVAVALTAARLRLQVRPELVTMLLAIVLVALFTAGPRGRWTPLLLVPLFPLWVNLHPGFFLGLGLLGCAASGALADRILARWRDTPPAPAWGEVGARWLTLALCVLAGLANPWGWRLYEMPLVLARAIRASNLYNPEFAPPHLATQPLFFALVAVTVLLTLLAARRLAATTLLLVAALAAYSLLFSRGTGLFCFAAPILMFEAATALAGRRRWMAGALRLPARAWGAVVLLVAVAAVAVGLRQVPLRLGFGVDGRWAPVGAADFLLRTRPEPELYNEIGDGGYLIWRLGPHYPVFVDGRTEPLADLVAEWSRAQANPADWSALLARYRVNIAVLRYTFEPLFRVPGQAFPVTFSRAFFPTEHWALVYWDDHNLVLLRRTPPNAALIAAEEYRCLHPEDLDNAAARMGYDPAFAACVRSELRRRLHQEPPSGVAQHCLESLPR